MVSVNEYFCCDYLFTIFIFFLLHKLAKRHSVFNQVECGLFYKEYFFHM